MMLWMKFRAWLCGGRLVWLRDHEGDVYLTIARWRKDPWGGWWAPVYWLSNVGNVQLLDGGKVGPKGHYVQEWRYVDEPPQGSAIPHRGSAA